MVLVHLATGARELDIVANINKKIICASCEQLSLDPHLMSCGNVLCPKCLTSVSVGDNVCPCGTECGHPFSFRNFELQVLNLMVRCPDGCRALVPMRCVDAHLRKCSSKKTLIRSSPAYDVDDVFKIVDNLADTVSVAIDLGYPLKFETPPAQIQKWIPETPPPPPALALPPPLPPPSPPPPPPSTAAAAAAAIATTTLQSPKPAEMLPTRLEAPATSDYPTTTTKSVKTKGALLPLPPPPPSTAATIATTTLQSPKPAKMMPTILEAPATTTTKSASEANDSVKVTLSRGQETSSTSEKLPEAESSSKVVATPISATRDDKSSKLGQSQFGKKIESDPNPSSTTCKRQAHHRKMRENDTLYMDEGVLKLLESGVSGRTRGVQKSGLDSEKDFKKDDTRSGRASPTTTTRRSSLSSSSRSSSKEYSSMYNLKPFRIVIERIPDEIFKKHLSAEGELLGKKRKSEEGSETMKKPSQEACTLKQVRASSSSSSSLQRGASNVKDGKHPDDGTMTMKTPPPPVKSISVAGNVVQQHPPKISSSSKVKSVPSIETAAAAAAAARNAKQAQTSNDAISKVTSMKSEEATGSVASSKLENLNELKPVAHDQRAAATAKGNAQQLAPPRPIASAQTSVTTRPAVHSSVPSLIGESVAAAAGSQKPTKQIAGKFSPSQLFDDGSKSVSRKIKRIARRSDIMTKKTAVAVKEACGSAGKPIVKVATSDSQTAVGNAGKISTTKTSFGVKKDETSIVSSMSFKIPRKSAIIPSGGGTPEPTGAPAAAAATTISPCGGVVVDSRVTVVVAAVESKPPPTPQDQRNSPPNKKRAFLSNQHPVEIERKRGRIEERRSSSGNMSSSSSSSTTHQGLPQRRQSSGCNNNNNKSDKIFQSCVESSLKHMPLRVMSSVSAENEPSSEADHLSSMSVPVRIPLEPQVAVKESAPQPTAHRLTERPVMELGVFSLTNWSDQVPSDRRHSGNKDERSSLSPPPPQAPQQHLSDTLISALSSSPSMSLLSSSSSSALFDKLQPFDARFQQSSEPSQLYNSMQLNNPLRRFDRPATLLKMDPRRGCIDPRSGAATAAIGVSQKSSPSYPPPAAGYGTIVYQRGHLSSSWLGDAVLETSSFWSSHG